METLHYEYQGNKPLERRAHVGVVASGDLEILFEPSDDLSTKVKIRTGSEGFAEIWKKVLDRFFAMNDVAARIEINDFGATPGVVSMRLAQALEVSRDHENNEK
ncbi:malonate decarboxylase delta subunit [Scopulibacillus darangshiensis]|uniref:Malonate decarboxylase acyl carrier protein n=1 Tax=Scopulibacillus darangshiensis TaxID=442528 RepID=A0A4R2P7K3_9BACL|nr:malonate decarboxylase subunit delta [Scopulibacillus darangshiensis]TCP30872.1 malonate decarboxylase delta subunit [Scopulibacillus darangshiensis]